MKYKAIFIDIDDTLLDYIPCCREAFDAAMKGLPNPGDGLRDEDELFQIFFSISGRLFSEAKRGLHTVAEVMELYPKEFIATIGYPEEAVDPFKQAFRAAWGETHTLVPGAKECLEALHNKGYRLFAASNSFGHLQRSRLQHAGILHYFEDTYISMDIGYDKPDVRFYEHALRRCGLQPTFLPPISSPKIAPANGPIITPAAPKNRPANTPIVLPHTPYLVPPNCLVPHAGTT